MPRFFDSLVHRGDRRGLRRMNARRPRGMRYFESLETRSLLAAKFIINEFLAANGNNLVDGFGERSDWIEIRNIGDTSGDLVGYHLTDSKSDLAKSTFPANTVVPAGGYLVVFASGTTRSIRKGVDIRTLSWISAANTWRSPIRAMSFNPSTAPMARTIPISVQTSVTD